ncbi:MAG: regulator [Chryseolinea sp.]
MLHKNSNPLAIFVSALMLLSCQKNQETPAISASVDSVFTDTTFWQELHEGYPVGKSPSSNEVRSIRVASNGDAWIATAEGIFRKTSKTLTWENILPVSDQGPSFSVAIESNGTTVWMSTWNAVYRYRNSQLTKMDGPVAPIAKLCYTTEGIYAVGPNGIWLFANDKWEKKHYDIARSVRDIKPDGASGLLIGTDVGLYHIENDTPTYYFDTTKLISAYVRGVAIDKDKRIWAVGLGGASILNDKFEPLKKLQPADGIPALESRCVYLAPDNSMWIGTDIGVVRYDRNGNHSLRFSKRWLLDDKVNDITFDGDGNAWVATNGGVSLIRKKRMTLTSKESYFYDVLMRRHIRDPWIAGQCRLPIAGDTTKWEPEDDDNDGEYTGNYLAMESFRYAVTKSDDAKAKAKKAFGFLKLLADVTSSDGFFARTIVPSDWTFVHDGNRTYTEREKADELVKEPRFKPVEIRWRKSKDGKWLWKGDTSSDEICGHMFGYYFYFELVADEEEKRVISDHVTRIVDHLINHNFTLTDVDGKPTRWGIWSPDRLNRDPEWFPDRSLNSMELLSFTKLAYHVSGNQKYQDIYLKLINEQKYLENMSRVPMQNPAWLIYYDIILAAYQYPILLHCEKDPELLKFYQNHIDDWLTRRKEDHNPLINFIYCYSRNKKAELKGSIDFLTDTPLDLVDWPIDHIKRADITTSTRPVLGDVQVSMLQPASIRATVRWDKNPWSITGANPHVEREPVFWLLPYWMGRYMEMIK